MTEAAVEVQAQSVFTSDIDNFWQAYDSIQTTDNFSRKLELINQHYLDKASPGLQSFAESRNYTDTVYVRLLEKFPKFWASIRGNTLRSKEKAKDIDLAIARLKVLYPELKEAQIYFTIGGLNSGGTTDGLLSLIGCEIAAADESVDTSEFTEGWYAFLADLFKTQSLENMVYINVHEYVHTQQTENDPYVLAHSLKEGSCDFIAELVLEEPLSAPYISYGLENEEVIKKKFRDDLFKEDSSDWLYNSGDTESVGDLGYFMGYAICKAYYERSRDKKLAVKEIIELNYLDSIAVVDFLNRSGYYKDYVRSPALWNPWGTQLF
ncbi:hypothetical protein BST85_11205 [Aureitalea marina]|uniref:DUF2268 domain-containing protein n=1 Tax=Aureitalea marina TaxID=930804 RepID=A0A2S7KTU5_9FLAO|nr:hypothetical protein BST85_11205 [Aureitalea marina]